MKTGTPPRIDGRSLDYSKMEITRRQNPSKFSYTDTPPIREQKVTSHILTKSARSSKGGFTKSPMFNGRILEVGPRYCPSIEDKIERFSERNRYQIFVKPEGWNTAEVYINGFSTSLPENSIRSNTKYVVLSVARCLG